LLHFPEIIKNANLTPGQLHFEVTDEIMSDLLLQSIEDIFQIKKHRSKWLFVDLYISKITGEHPHLLRQFFPYY